MSVQPGGLYIHLPLHTQVLGLLRRQEHVVSSQTGEFLYFFFTMWKRNACESSRGPEPQSLSFSAGLRFCFLSVKKVYSQIRSFSIAARDFLPFVHMCRWKNLALEKRCPLRYTLDEVSA